MASPLSKQAIADLAKQLSDALDEHDARKAAAPSLLEVLDALQPMFRRTITPEFRERARRIGAKLRAFQEEGDRAFRAQPQAQLQRGAAEPEPFDCSRLIGVMEQSAVADLLKAQCGTRRRKRLPEGPTRQRSAQGGSHA